MIHPRVFSLLGVDAFQPGSTSFTGIVDDVDAVKLDVVGEAFLRVEDPDHPHLCSSTRQLFYICRNMHKGVTLSLPCCQNLGIVPRELKIARKGAMQVDEMEERLANMEELLAISEERRLVAVERQLVAEERRLVAEELSYLERVLDELEQEVEEGDE